MSRPMFMSFLRRVESCFRDECVDLGRLGFDYVAFLGDEPVAVCSLIVRRKVATLGGMATLPRHRGRGIQDALLRARIDLARALGCDLAITSCESGSGSGRNITRAGFRHLTNHGFFQRPGEPAS